MKGTICAAELKELTDRRADIQLVDVRTPSEYAVGHVPRAVNLPLEQIEARLEDIHPGSPVVLICQSGQRACLAAVLLRPWRADVTVLDGGTLAWKNCGLPVVVNARTRWSLERQVRLIAGVLVLVGSILALGISPHWAYLAGFVGLGLTFAGLSDVCLMASLLCRMPWNRPIQSRRAPASQGKVCSLKKVTPPEQAGETILS